MLIAVIIIYSNAAYGLNGKILRTSMAESGRFRSVAQVSSGPCLYQFKEKRSVNIDEAWLHTMLAAIGETLEKDETDGEVMGVVVNVRKAFFRVGLWTKTVGKPVPGGGDADVAGGKGRSSDKSKQVLMGIGQRFKDVLQLSNAETLEFSGHTDSANAGSTRAKAKLTC